MTSTRLASPPRQPCHHDRRLEVFLAELSNHQGLADFHLCLLYFQSKSHLNVFHQCDKQKYSPAVKPYACGRESCWPAGATSSSACFQTSKELLDHSRNDHTDDAVGNKPFRCALAGCGKSWKASRSLPVEHHSCHTLI